jgi:hypothetical protein
VPSGAVAASDAQVVEFWCRTGACDCEHVGDGRWLALVLLHHPKLPNSSVISPHDFVGVLQLMFASVAEAGALVALVMTYRRQR